jgi:hypothetical protein
MFGEDDGTRINDRLARYLVESLNADLTVEDPNPEEGWFLEGPEDGEQDPAILICDPEFEVRLEILDTENLEEDQALDPLPRDYDCLAGGSFGAVLG